MAKTATILSGLQNKVKTLRIPAKRKSLFLLLALTAVGLLLLAKSLFFAAFVNGRPISRLSVLSELEKAGGKDILNSLIDKALIYQEASRLKVKVDSQTLNAEVGKIEDSLTTQGVKLDEALSERGQTRADLLEQIKLQKTVELLLADKIKVSDEEILKYFQDNKTTLGKDTKLEDIKDKIAQQIAFEKLSSEYSTLLEQLRTKAKITTLVNY